MKTNNDKSKELTEDQVNLILATFEGRELIKKGRYWFLRGKIDGLDLVYTEDLNSLVTIWDKLKARIEIDAQYRFIELHIYELKTIYLKDIKDIKIAAAHATALACLEIKPELKELL